MIHQLINICIESVYMVKRNIKTYILLSVTMILTFSALGIFIFVADSQIFFENKDFIKVSPKISVIDYTDSKSDNVVNFKNQLKKMKNTNSCTVMELVLEDDDILTDNVEMQANIHAIFGKNLWAYYYSSTDENVDVKRMITTEGDYTIEVNPGEVVISESLYKCLEKSQKKEEDGFYYIKVPYGNVLNREYKNLKVVGTVEDYLEEPVYTINGRTIGEFDFFVNIDDFAEMNTNTTEKRMIVVSDQSEAVTDMALSMGLNFNTPLPDKMNAYQKISNIILIKAAIIIAILIILGINLYSCFSNALNERKFEIGVKRAIGASKFNIILQFLVEGIVVMMVDLLISIAVITTVLTGIKLFYLLILKEHWSIIIYSYSVSIYLVSCIFMSLFFSAMFSIMTTRVEITSQLKGE